MASTVSAPATRRVLAGVGFCMQEVYAGLRCTPACIGSKWRMAQVKARIVWDDELNFHIEPELSAADTLRFMIESPEYHAAQELWRERNRAAGTFAHDNHTVVIRPEGTLLNDLENGGPTEPKLH